MERGEIEVSHVLRRDKQLNKMLLMAVRWGAICREQLRDDWMLMRLQMFSQVFFKEIGSGNAFLGNKISVTTLL